MKKLKADSALLGIGPSTFFTGDLLFFTTLAKFEFNFELAYL